MTSPVHPDGRRHDAAPPQVGFKLLSDTGGEITRIAIKIPFDVFSGANPAQDDAYDDLLKELAGRDMDIVAVADRDNIQAVTDRIAAAGFPVARRQVLDAPHAEFLKSLVWMRDCMLCAIREDGSPVFLHANGPSPYSLKDLSLWLSSGIQRPVQQMDFLLAGGSSLTVGDAYWIVGAEAVDREMDAGRNLSWGQAIKKMKTGMGRPPIIAGFRFRDKPHQVRWVHKRFVSTLRKRLPADLGSKNPLRRFLIVAWTGVSAFGSVARDLVTPGRLYWDWSHIDMIVSVTGVVRDGKPVLLVADPSLPGCPASPNASDSKAELDSLARVIERTKKFHVIRNPAPCVGILVLGYNNTIVQTNPNVVMLPVFSGPAGDFEIADQANIKIWEDLGFRVVKVPGWAVFRDGCIRCTTLPLERKP